MQKLLEKIRNSEPANKKKLLIILTAASMIVIITCWLFYMNAFIFSSSNEQTTAEVKTDFWLVFATEAKIFAGKIGTGITDIFSNIFSKLPKLGGENKITIENPK